jgi:hypothetical protein
LGDAFPAAHRFAAEITGEFLNRVITGLFEKREAMLGL